MANWHGGEDVRIGDVYRTGPFNTFEYIVTAIGMEKLTYKRLDINHTGSLALDQTRFRYLQLRRRYAVKAKEPRSGFGRFIRALDT